MTTKALITRRGPFVATSARATERSSAESLNLNVEHELSHASLVKGEAADLLELEKQGFRVKLFTDTNIVQLGDYRIDTETQPPKLPRGLSVPKNAQASWLHHLVQFIGPIQEEWVTALEQLGVDVVEPISPYGVFVVAPLEVVEGLRELDFVDWIGLFQPACGGTPRALQHAPQAGVVLFRRLSRLVGWRATRARQRT